MNNPKTFYETPNSTGECYFTYRLVESRKLAGKSFNQHTLLNLGTNFDPPTET